MKIVSRAAQLISLVSIAALAAGCAGGGGAPQTTASSVDGKPVAGEVSEGAYSGKQFSFIGFGGTPQEHMMEILTEFADTAQAKVVGDSPPEQAKLQAQVTSGNVTWDVVATSSVNAVKDCGVLFEPWDYSRIDTSKLPAGVEHTECGMPQTLFSTGLAYDSEVFKEAPKTYADFFDTEKFPGKRALYGTDAEMNLEIALLADGVPADQLYPLDLKRAFAKLDTIRDDLVFYATGAESEQILESDRASLCLCWAGRVFAVNENGGAWAFVPEAPQIARQTVMGLVKGSKNGDVATGAMNYFLGADQQAKMQEASAYPALNVGAKPTLSDNAKAVDFLHPPFAPIVPMDLDFWVANKPQILDQWVGWTSRS